MKDDYRLFVEKAHKLETSPFWHWLTSKRGQPDMDRIMNGDWLAHDGLRTEEFEAFCLTLRLLIQDGDGFSIREIAQNAEAWPKEYHEEIKGIEAARQTLNKRLDEKSLVSLSPQDATTNRELFDVIFYGGIVHSNPNKRTKYEQFVKSGLFSFFAFQAFSGVLMHYRNCIQNVAYNLVRYVQKSEASKPLQGTPEKVPFTTLEPEGRRP